MEESKIDSIQEKCKNCGGNLVFSPKSQDLVCKKCDSHYSIVNNNTFEYHDLSNYLNQKEQDSQKYKQYIEKNKIFKCPNCGASVVLNKFEISKVCPYCTTPLAIEEENIQGLCPDTIIPFAFDEDEASTKFANSVKKRFWAPRKFKKKLPSNEITGIYFPSFGFNVSTKNSYEGKLYRNETYYDSDGKSHTERSYFHISGGFNKDYSDVMVECSSHINQAELNGFLPFEHEKKQAFTNEFILGYSVEQYDREIQNCLDTYRSELNNKIKSDILRKYTYDGISYLNIKTEKSNEKFLYQILPVYKFEYDYKNKKYITYMNGQTGKVDGNTPKSGLKIAIAVILGILLIAAIVIISMLTGSGS